jgi:hypothetical protein
MNAAVLSHVPRGEDLARAVFEIEENDQARRVKAQIQRGLDAANDPNAPRTPHKVFMAELKAEILRRIDAR